MHSFSCVQLFGCISILVGGFGVYYSFFNPKKSSQESGGNTVQGDIVVDPQKDDSDTTKKTVDEKAENMLKVKNPIKIFTLPNGVKLEMVKIKAGSFTMGCPTSELGCWDDEGEVSVKLTKDYYIGKYEVTQAQWESIMKGKRSRRDDKDISNPSYFKSPDRPVECVTWDDARDFCAKLNSLNYKNLVINGVRYKFDLPTEAQWEYACRAGTTTSLNSGENMQICATNDSPNLDEVGWYAGNCGQDFELSNGYDISSWKDKQYSDTKGGTHPVGKKQPNKWGLYDMHGNVAEWCLDDYSSSRSSSMAEFSRLNPDSGSRHRVWRGGGWSSSAGKCRSASRGGNHVGMGGTYGRYVRFIDLGFRVALVPAE